MFKIIMSFKRGPSLTTVYRGSAPMIYARRQRAIYKAECVAVFDETDRLVCTAIPTRKTRMPKGPQGQKRPADVIGKAIKVARIATGKRKRR